MVEEGNEMRDGWWAPPWHEAPPENEVLTFPMTWKRLRDDPYLFLPYHSVSPHTCERFLLCLYFFQSRSPVNHDRFAQLLFLSTPHILELSNFVLITFLRETYTIAHARQIDGISLAVTSHLFADGGWWLTRSHIVYSKRLYLLHKPC